MRPSTVRRAIASLVAFLIVTSVAVASPTDVRGTDIDRTVKPGDDFYRLAVGGWLARNSIPPDRARWGAFDELVKVNERRLIGILRSPAVTDAPVGSEARKLGDVYAACTDAPGVDRAGTTALGPSLRAIAGLRSARDLSAIFAAANFSGSEANFGFAPEQDPADAHRVIVSLGQGGLSLPTREYYLSSAPRSKAIRSAFVREIAATLRASGDAGGRAAAAAADVLAFETRLARFMRAPDALRDPIANYHPMSIGALRRLAPHIDWTRYFASSGVAAGSLARIDVAQPEFFRGFDALVATVPLVTWQRYLRWHQLAAVTVALPTPYRDAAFAVAREFSGQPVRTPRDRTCARLVDRTLGFALGNTYVATYFPPSARARARAEIVAIKAALRDRIAAVAWMGPQTRAAALAKLAKLDTAKVGYPDRPRSYAALHVSRVDLLADVLASHRFEMRREIAKIGKPVDRSEWGMTPQTVNAYYNPALNEIVIPAGILQAPFFDARADDATNFGGIGAIIGHELTHGFDDEGSNFDGDGNLHAIVTKADAAKFHARVGCIVAQANRFVVPELGLHLNGKLDAGEAAADLGGTTIAYHALHAGTRRTSPTDDGFTADQRFFLNWAQVWRSKSRLPAQRAQVLGDPHPVSVYRVNATLANEAPFYTAFGVKPGDAMYRPPAQRCSVW
ncbi:MAG: M13 family metallopeptidase [Vulcanimicrobiaceae bacterium]